MVLFKRKPVQNEAAKSDAPEDKIADNDQVWGIDETGEIYNNYEPFLNRMYFYQQRKFTCSITGQSGLDFFSALRSEQEASHDVEDVFPDALRRPILRKVQHSTISRIDNLVDHVYDEFKSDFFPGESVNVLLASPENPDGERAEGLVREKTHLSELRDTQGGIQREQSTRYMVSLLGFHTNREAHVDSSNVYRDRKAFTKQMLRPFLKNALHRESWSGAPWQVKSKLAEQYSINQAIPVELTYDYQVAQRKAAQEAKKVKIPSNHEQQRMLQQQFIEYKRALTRDPSIRRDPNLPQSIDDPEFREFMAKHPGFTAKSIERVPPVIIKYPREDLENDIRGILRPNLKFMTTQASANGDSSVMDGVISTIKPATVGRLLEAWNTLNVYCEVFVLDSFTFDDFVEALQFTPDQQPNELIIEIHCAILKKLVNSELDKNGQVQITLPTAADDDDEEEDEEDERTPTPEPEVKTRTTRRSLAKAEAAELSAQAALAAKPHNGAEIDQCVKGHDWRFRLRKRDFAHGKWVLILVGLFNVYTRSLRHKAQCEEILKVLAPTHLPATEEIAIDQYYSADINTRASILQILCELSVETKAMRDYMEECSMNMTEYRKEKIDWQRKKKTYVEDLKKLDDERRALQPEMAATDPGLDELKERVEQEVKEEEEQAEEEEVEDSEDSEPIPTRSLRRGNDRAAERKKRAEEQKQKKAKAETEKAKKPTKEEKRLEKILKEIDGLHTEIKHCEDEVADCDNDLREADCQRSRVLGIDRFWNRYYWFERNGMPFGGLPDSSTAEAGYANGCLWVQGPDIIEREGFLIMNEADNQRYKQHFNVTVPERKIQEEGETHVDTAQDWGYYDDVEDLDRLIAWLDVKGVRELKLRKQLMLFQPHIEANMRKRQAYLNPSEEEREESVEPVKRVSTRTKVYVEQQPAKRSDKWHNTTAVSEEGHIHSEPPRGTKRGSGKIVSGRTKPAPKESPEPAPRQTRGAAKPKAKANKGYGLR